jgi:hypothetical protein
VPLSSRFFVFRIPFIPPTRLGILQQSGRRSHQGAAKQNEPGFTSDRTRSRFCMPFLLRRFELVHQWLLNCFDI